MDGAYSDAGRQTDHRELVILQHKQLHSIAQCDLAQPRDMDIAELWIGQILITLLGKGRPGNKEGKQQTHGKLPERTRLSLIFFSLPPSAFRLCRFDHTYCTILGCKVFAGDPLDVLSGDSIDLIQLLEEISPISVMTS